MGLRPMYQCLCHMSDHYFNSGAFIVSVLVVIVLIVVFIVIVTIVPSCSPFPPCKQLLTVVVGGAMVMVVMIIV